MNARSSSGYTLIETLSVTLVSSIVLAGMTSFYVFQQQTFVRQQMSMDASQAIRATIELLIRDLRIAGFDPNPDTGDAFGIVEAEAGDFSYTADANRNDQTKQMNDVLEPEEQFRYRLQGTSVEYCQGTTGGGESCFTITEGVTLLAFTYFDTAGNVIAPPGTGVTKDMIRRVDVELQVTRSGPYGGPPIRQTHRGSAILRNMG